MREILPKRCVVRLSVNTPYDGGIEALLPKERIGMHRNLSFEEEKEFLSAYTKQAEAGQIVDLNEMKAAYIEKVGHSIGGSQIYRMLERHG